MKTKQVNYAYPTSEAAEYFSCGKTGGWVVEVGESNMCFPFDTLSIHFSEKDAISAAYEIELPWSFHWLNVAKNQKPTNIIPLKTLT